MAKTVKARAHPGANSLNLTIPAEIVRIYNLKAGDIFELTVDAKEQFILSYRRVYSSPQIR